MLIARATVQVQALKHAQCTVIKEQLAAVYSYGANKCPVRVRCARKLLPLAQRRVQCLCDTVSSVGLCFASLLVRPALPAAQLTKMPLSMALNAAMAMGS